VDHELNVEVVDPAGNAVPDATVSIVPDPEHTGNVFPFVPPLPVSHAWDGARYTGAVSLAAGRWMLVVKGKDKAAIAQPLQLKEKKGVFTASPSPGQLAAVTLAHSKVTAGTAKRTIDFKVTLYPASEVVFVSGTNYHEGQVGTGFAGYARDRAVALFRTGVIDAGCRVTVLNCDAAAIETYFVGAKKAILAGSHDLGGEAVKDGRYHPLVVGKDVTIVTFYDYLSETGKYRPGTVKEAGIFSHSYENGPILWDTFEREGWPDKDERDPEDGDARRKDFLPVNAKKWAHMPKAFAKGSAFQLWGCSADQRKRRFMKKLRDEPKAAPEAWFTDSESEDGIRRKTNLTPSRLRRVIQDDFEEGSYCARAAKFLGVASYCAPPGVGSDLYTVKGLRVQGIEEAGFKTVYKYLSETYGDAATPTRDKYNFGYVDYLRLQQAKAPAPPVFSTRDWTAVWQPGKDGGFALRFGKKFWGSRKWWEKVVKKEDDFELDAGEVTSLGGTAGNDGHRYVVKHKKDAKKSFAYLYRADDKLFPVTLDANKEWTVVGAELPVGMLP
jgi:hypothetical protein